MVSSIWYRFIKRSSYARQAKEKSLLGGAGSLLIPRSGDVLHQFGYHSHNMENVDLYWPRDGFGLLFFIEREEESFIYIGGIILFFHCYQNQPSLTQLLKP